MSQQLAAAPPSTAAATTAATTATAVQAAQPTEASRAPNDGPVASTHGGRRLRDPAYLWAWLVHVAIVFLIGTIAGNEGSRTAWVSYAGDGRLFVQIWVFVAAFVGAMWGTAMLRLLLVPWVRSELVRFAQPISGTLFLIQAILLFAVGGHWFLGCLALTIMVADLLWVLRSKPNLPFVHALVDVAAKVLLGNMDLFLIVLAACAAQIVMLIGWGLMLHHVLRTGDGRTFNICIIGVMLFSLRWSTNIAKGIVRVCVSGTLMLDLLSDASPADDAADEVEDEERLGLTSAAAAGSGAIDDAALVAAGAAAGAAGAGAGAGEGAAGQAEAKAKAEAEEGEGEVVHQPVHSIHRPRHKIGRRLGPMQFLRQACTISLGSICAGALVSSVAPVLWSALSLARRWERGGPCCRAVGRAFTVLLQGLLRNCHKYAYPEVALHGTPWFRAARDSWTAFDSKSLEAVVEADCSDRFMSLLCYIGASAVSIICSTMFIGSVRERAWVIVSFIVFWFMFASCSLALASIEAVITTLFVSFADAPESLSQQHPIIYHRLCRVTEVRSFQRQHNPHAGVFV